MDGSRLIDNHMEDHRRAKENSVPGVRDHTQYLEFQEVSHIWLAQSWWLHWKLWCIKKKMPKRLATLKDWEEIWLRKTEYWYFLSAYTNQQF